MLTANFGRVEWASVRNRVYSEIRDQIVSGRLSPGQTMTLRSLAALHGTSPMPVREAIMRLVSEGAIELHLNKTFSIVKLTPERFLEIKKIRLKVEGWAAELAASRIVAEEIEYLQLLLRRMEAEVNSSSDNYLVYNRHLHFTIYNASRMPELVNIIENLWIKYGPALNYFSKADGARFEGNRVHRTIVEAITARDPAASRAAIQGDIRAAADVIYPRLAEQK